MYDILSNEITKKIKIDRLDNMKKVYGCQTLIFI
jgi:hypothetical protein